MRRALLGLLGALGLAGCAGHHGAAIRSAEQALAAAGFETRPADTPEKLAQLHSLTPRTVLWRPQAGELRYVYADPTSCRCLYVGGEPEYQQYQKLRLQKDFADEESSAMPDWGWGGWGAWWSPWRQWP